MKLHRPRPVLLSLLALAPPARAAARKAAGWVRLGLVRDFRLCKMLFLQVALLLAGVCLVSGQTADDGFTPSLDDVVYAFAVQPDGKIVAAGQFSRLYGSNIPPSLIRFNHDGASDNSFRPALGEYMPVNSVALQPDGKIIIGGQFEHLSGQNRLRIGRLNPDGSLDPSLDAPASGNVMPTRVDSIVVQADGGILVGGNFWTLGGQPHKAIGRINASGSVDHTFTAQTDGAVNGIALQADGKILVAGSFSTLNGGICPNLGRLNPDGTLDTSFKNPAPNAWLECVAVQPDGKILLAGYFTSLNGVAHPRIARLNPDGQVDSTFNPTADAIVHAMALQPDGMILVGGQFTNLCGQARRCVGRLRSDGSLDSLFNARATPGMYGAGVLAIALQADRGILLGGDIGTLGGQSHWNIGRLYPNGSADETLKPAADDRTYGLATQPDGKILVTGYFHNLGGQSHEHIGRLNSDGTLDSNFTAVANWDVYVAAIQQDGRILVGGDLSTLNGQARNYIGRMGADGSLDADFNPGANGRVSSLLLQTDGKILVAGYFTSLGGQPRGHVGRLNANGSIDLAFLNPSADATVYCMALQVDGKILVGGYFNTIGGQNYARIARLNADGTADATFIPAFQSGIGGYVYTLAVQADGKILVGGQFSQLSGQNRNYIGRLNANGSLDESFNPGADGSVLSMAIQANGKIVVGGLFTHLAGQPLRGLGRLNADGTLDSTFISDASGGSSPAASSLALQEDGKLLAGGGFTLLNGQSRTNIGRLSAGEGAWQNLTLDFDGGIATWNRGGTGPELYQVFIEYSRDGVTYSPLGNGQRITNGWQITSLSWLPWANIYLRARGFTTGGFYNGSSGLVESVRRFHNGANDVPVALCRSAIVLAGTNGTAAASIDNGSFDPDPGDTITLVQTPPGPYPPGTNAVTLTVTDNHGDWSSCNATVTVFRLGQTSSLIPTGSVWKYLDTGTNLGTAWKETNFNDSAWASGPAQLGYGDGDEATVVSYGTNSSSKYITTYFRRSFYLPVTSWITNLAARYIRDDGAVVYLNGVEVFRSNMPGGMVSYTTLASGAEDTSIENAFHTNAIPAGLLVPGTNVIAVEVHQAAVASSDLSFELELIANTGIIRMSDPLPPPWINLDVGGPGLAGSASYVTNNPVWLVQSGGGDIYGTNDQCHFVYDSVLGNCEIRARVAALGNSSNWAKAGVMIREALQNNAKSAFVALTPVNGTEYVYRTNTGATATPASQSGPAAPFWVRLVRTGTTVTGYTSPEGLNWTQVFSTSISLSNRVLVGLAVASVSTNKACLAAFDQVSGLSFAASHADIGSPTLASSFLLETNTPAFIVAGSGSDIWDYADQFHYVFQPVTGDCALQARVTAQANTDPWAKSGVMLRETLNPDSSQANICMTPGHGASMEWRPVAGGASSAWEAGTDAAPYWIKLARTGTTFTSYKSSDGVNWVQVQSATISMAATIYGGVVCSSHNNGLTGLAAFDAVDFLPVVNAVSAMDGDLFYWSDPIELHAEAADHDGHVAQVRYYDQATNFIGAASVPPYAFVWTNAPPGMNYVSARAMDDQGVLGEPTTRALFMVEPDTHVWFHPEFPSSDGLVVQGMAGTTNNMLRLSPSAGGLGGAWLANRLVLSNGFETFFQFRITEQTGFGADGFAFVLAGLPSPRLGGGADGLGYNGLTNSLAVEFDTYDGSSSTYNELAVHSRGVLANSSGEDGTLATTTNFPYVSDGTVHTVRVLYQPGLLRVFVDDLNAARLSLPLDLSTWLNLDAGRAWVGFTAGTGGDKERHDILNWSFVTTNLHPVISLTAPTNGAVFLPADSLVVNAAASDLDGTIQQVVFFVDGNYVGSATQSPWQVPVGALPAGPHVLSAAALDDTDAATVSAPVTILVNTPPVAQCRDVTVLADATCTASAIIDGGSYDADPGDEIKLVQTPIGPYPLGSTVVTLIATDSFGASNACAATITVLDITPPTITCISDITVSTATGSCFSNVAFTVTGSDLCGAVNVLCVPPSGSAFAKGPTPVNCTATDAASNTATCTFTVTVTDPEPPQITCPSDIAVSTASGSCASNVVFTAPATDNCGTVNVACVPPSGSAFAVGTNLVNCSATDGASNTVTCAFTVTVTDPEPPQLTCPTNLVVAADAGQCLKSNVTWTASVTDNCAVTNVVCEPTGGSTFVVGVHPVACTASDASGNTASCNFTVTILDTEPPAVICPANLVVNPPVGSNTATVTFTVTAADNCDLNPAIVCAPPSGTSFPIGTTPVQCVATDTAANTNACNFSIRVNARPLVSLVAPTNNATFPLAQPISLLADASDPDGDGVARVDFLAGTNLLGSATSGYLFVWANAPVGPHSLTARATDGAGAEATSSAVQITVLAQPPITYAPVSSSNLNRQTGLYVQPVRITNPTASTFDALRLWTVLDTNSLAHNVRVWNATGTSNSVPFVLYNQPLLSGQSVDLSIEYYIPDRRTMPNPVFTVELIPAVAPPDPAGTVLEVDRALRLADGTFWVEFSTLSNRVYYLQYSGDVSAWKSALPAVLGTGHRVYWRDAGPPKTESAPQSVPNRFYRIILLP